MSRRTEIQELESLRGNRVIAYVTGDRPPTVAHIADDALRPIFDVLEDMGPVEAIDLFIYSRGGGTEVPWRIATALRQYSDNWNILVPYRANSAATLLALGADKIILGRHGELGPIDPTLNIQRQPGVPGQPGNAPAQDSISVEDVMSYFAFVKDELGLTDQSALANSLEKLAERLDAVGLGSVYRTRSHIRDVAHRMLTSQQNPLSERTMEAIVETLATRVYAHGHAIGFREASDIGLPVDEATDDVDLAMWKLLRKYEDDLRLREPIDPVASVDTGGRFEEEMAIAVVESSDTLFELRGKLYVQANRQMPATLNVALNLNLQLPPSVDPADLPVELQQQLQQLQGRLLPIAEESVKEALKDQAPVITPDVKFLGGKWARQDPS